MQSSQDELAPVAEANLDLTLIPLFSTALKEAKTKPYETFAEFDRVPLKDSLLCKSAHPSNGPPLV